MKRIPLMILICLFVVASNAQNVKLSKRITFRGITLKVPAGVEDLNTQAIEAEASMDGAVSIKFGVITAHSTANAAKNFAKKHGVQTSGFPMNADLANVSYSILRASDMDENGYWAVGTYAYQESYGILIQYKDPSFQKVAKRIANSVRASNSAPTPSDDVQKGMKRIEFSSWAELKEWINKKPEDAERVITGLLEDGNKLENNKTIQWGGLSWSFNDQSKVNTSDTSLTVGNGLNYTFHVRKIPDMEVTSFKASKERLYESVGQSSVSLEDKDKRSVWVAFHYLGFCEREEPIDVDRLPGTTVIPFASRRAEHFELSYLTGTFSLLQSDITKISTIIVGLVVQQPNGTNVNYQAQINTYHPLAMEQMMKMIDGIR